MGIHVMAVYRAKDGKAGDLAAEIAGHVPRLRRLGLATDTPSLVLRADDGVYIEYFEWASRQAIGAAHEHPEVLEMWARHDEVCTFATLADLPNAATMFAEFERVGSY